VERLTYDEDTAFLLADNAATLARIVRTVPADRLRATRFGEWTAVEVLGHLADAAEIFADRVQRCIDEDRPAIASYDQDALAAERRNAERDPMGLSERVMSAHRRMIQLLVQADNRRRPGIHGQWGEVDAGHFAAYQAGPARDHVAELAKVFPPTA
jgi:hypothetical protein